MKNSTLATLLNLIPGLGYIYVGRRPVFGFLLLAGVLVLAFAPEVSSSADLSETDLVSSIGTLFVIGAFMYDAYRDAELHNRSLEQATAAKN